MYVALALAVPVAAVVTFSVVVVYGLGWTPYNTPGLSMQPSLVVGDYFFVDRTAYRAELPKRGDIIAFYAPAFLAFGEKTVDGRGPEYVKRVIGLPGDRVEMTAAGPTINGTPVIQKRMGPYAGKTASGRARPTRLEERLPDGTSYEILKNQPIAPWDKGTFTVPRGSYFVLGDNRDDSIDSRSANGSQIGWYVPLADIIGRTTYVYWSGLDHLDRIGMAAK